LPRVLSNYVDEAYEEFAELCPDEVYSAYIAAVFPEEIDLIYPLVDIALEKLDQDELLIQLYEMRLIYSTFAVADLISSN